MKRRILIVSICAGVAVMTPAVANASTGSATGGLTSIGSVLQSGGLGDLVKGTLGDLFGTGQTGQAGQMGQGTGGGK
jgi:hypothetical protein